ncbi:hypothetical protein JHK82_031008 [Glycine max]|nr:hypothetical protein JHK87_030921 [Glycine soja]KAG5124271.1 hypothetical protein JHK82_031008 [Glycine max]
MPFLLLSCFFRRCRHRSQSLVSIVTQSWFVLDFSFVVDAEFGDDAWEALLPLEPDVAVVEAKELEDNRDLIDDFFLREGIGV